VDGANARTPTPEARHGLGESEITEARRPASPTPPPRRGPLSWGMPPAVGIVGPEDPRPQPSSRGGANVGSRAPLIGFAGSPGSLPLPSTPPLPGWLQGAMGGPAVGEARRQPPAAIGSSSLGHWPATGSRILPGPWRILDEGQLLHHLRPSPPGPRAAGSPETGTLYQKQSKHRHINRVEVGVGKVVGVKVGEVDGERRAQENIYKLILSRPLVLHLSISNDG